MNTGTKNNCVCVEKNCCEFEFDGWGCTKPKGHSGEHVACSIIEHFLATHPNDTITPVAALKNKLEKVEIIAQQIQELQRRAEDLFEEQIKPLAQNEGETNWLWDYCFNPSENDEYSKMVSKHVIDILSE